MIMMVRERRYIKPLLLKFGVAVVLSFAGFLYSRVRTRRIRPSQPRPPSSHSSDYRNEVDSVGGKTMLKDDIHSSQTTPSSCHSASITSEKHEETYIPKITVDNSLVGLLSSSIHSGDKDGYLLPEFNDPVKEFDFSATGAAISTRKDVEMPKAFRSSEKDDYDYEQEIKQLRNMVRILRERERNLEVQLLEYYGLKEQETAVMELQNRLKINNMEAKLFTLKIESLQADNRRLEAQVADYTKVTAELEAAKAKIKILKKKLRSEVVQNKEQILSLQKRVTKLQELEQKAAASDPDVQLKLQRLKELQGEAEELRKSNSSLLLENSELTRSLESSQILATSILDSPEAKALQGMIHRLRQENEDLSKEIEQLQADRCTDVEELVYLRWINACLRYELRNYQPPPGKTVAKELSKTLSPKSEEKAKQLILEYANTEGMGERGISPMDFDSDLWSSSQASFTDIGEFDDSPVDTSAANRTKTSNKTKFFTKLRRLLHGKDSHQHDHVSSSDKTASLEEMTRTYDCESPFGCSSISTVIDASTGGPSNAFTPLSQISLGPSPGIQKLRSLNREDTKAFGSFRRNSDTGSSIYYKQNILSGDGVMDSLQENQSDQDLDSVKKSELVKYAEVLRDSRGGRPRLHKKSKSCNIY